MNKLSRHTYATAITALSAFILLSCHYSGAQEVSFPDRWKDPLTKVRPIFEADTVTVCILGDMMMHENQIRNAGSDGGYDFSSYFSLIEDEIRKADIAVANMEFTLAGEPYSGYPCFSAPDEFADYLAKCGFDVFLAANNHIFDKGTAGAERTIMKYRELGATNGIRFTGIAADEDEMKANTPLIIRKRGVRLAFVNATYGTNIGLTTHWPRTTRLSAQEVISDALSRAEESDADIIMAFPHWGTEYVLTHSQEQEKTAAWLAESGADMIIGAHPHVIQDFQVMEVCKDGEQKYVPVAYSLGNAVSNMSAQNTQLELMAFVKIVRKTNGDIRVLPVEFTYLWCSRPGGYGDSFTVIPVEEFLDKKDKWKNSHDYDKMASTYAHVARITGIKDIHTISNE